VKVTFLTRLPRRVFGPITIALASLTLATACQPPRTSWKDIGPAPGGASYEGEQAETLVDQRLSSLLSERNLKLLGSRLEQLPFDMTFAQHVAWRDANDDDMRQLSDRVPEPDAPVMMAEFARAGRKLFVIGTVASGRTVVLTALTTPR
jgi:hypothetical protein